MIIHLRLETDVLRRSAGQLLRKFGKILFDKFVGRGRVTLLKYDPQPAITCSKLTIERLEQGVKYVRG